MQGCAIETAGTAASTDATDADVCIDDDRVVIGNRWQYPTTHTEASSRPTALLAPDDSTCVPTGRAGTDHIASADATIDATDCAARDQHHRTEREAGAVRAL